MSAIDVTGLTQRFGTDPVLSDLDLVVPAGSVTAVLGQSGCGKTTLLRAVAGLLRPDSGVIRLGDRTVFSESDWVRPERRNVGLVPQEGALFPHLDVAGNVEFGLKGSKTAKSARVAELLELVGMPGSERLRPNQLSGGMQQRVAVARALSRHPEVVLLDEPFSALDTSLREAVRGDVLEAIRADGATALLVTHDQEEALSVADRVAVMRAGRIVQEDTPTRIYGNPVDRELAAFVGEAVELPTTVVAVDPGGVSQLVTRSALGDLPLSSDDPTVSSGARGALLLRPEDLRLESKDGEGASATVESVRFHGHDSLVRVRLEAGPSVTIRRMGPSDLAPGDAVRVTHVRPPRFFPEPR